MAYFILEQRCIVRQLHILCFTDILKYMKQILWAFSCYIHMHFQQVQFSTHATCKRFNLQKVQHARIPKYPLWKGRGPYLVSRVVPHLARGERGWVSCHSSNQPDGPVLLIWGLGQFAYSKIFLSVCTLSQLPSPTKALFLTKFLLDLTYF